MKKIKLILLIALSAVVFNSCGSAKKVSSSVSGAGNNNKQTDVQTMKYIARYKRIAQKEMRDYGIPASITMAQGILESASGTSYLARTANNHFGIKCADNWDGPKVYKDDDHKNECFRKYKQAEESFRDHSKFLAKRRRYAFLFRLPPSDYEAWAKGLKKAGYATDPSYPSKLIYIIEKYKLHELDKEVLKGMKIKEEDLAHQTNKTEGEKIIYEVKPGETLYTIAKKFNIPVKEIKEMNNLVDFDIYEGQILVLKMPKEQAENIEIQTEETAEDKAPNTATEMGNKEQQNAITETGQHEETNNENQAQEVEISGQNEGDIRDKINRETNISTQESANTENSYVIHTVQPKETLFGISRQYNVSVEEIKRANGMTDNQLTIGQTLKIPVAHQEQNETRKTNNNVEPVSEKSNDIPEYHIVQPGETLYRIHVKYHIPIEKLRELNGLKNNTIRVGQKIKLR